MKWMISRRGEVIGFFRLNRIEFAHGNDTLFIAQSIVRYGGCRRNLGDANTPRGDAEAWP